MRVRAGLVPKVILAAVLGASVLGAVPGPVGTPHASAATFEVRTFNDVPGWHTFYDDVHWMAGTGISEGYVDGAEYEFRPDVPVTRMAMSAFLYRLAGEPTFSDPSTKWFVDVSTIHTFFTEIEWMRAEGITTGAQGSQFLPGNAVSRQAMSAFLFRVAGSPSFSPPGAATFSDVGTGHQFFAEIEWMASVGITSGYQDGTFQPSAAVTRQAISAFLRRLWQSPGVAPAIDDGGPGPRSAGAWSPSTAYDGGDVVEIGGSGPLAGGLYVATDDQTSGSTFGSSFHQAIAGRDEDPVPILAIGDSITEATQGSSDPTDAWPEQLQDRLRSRWTTTGNVGRGYLPARYEAPLLTNPTTSGSTSSLWASGFGWRGLNMQSGSSVTFSDVTGTTARVWYVTSSAGAPLQVDVGGVTVVDQLPTTGAAHQLQHVDVSLPSGSNTVTVSHDSANGLVKLKIGGLQVFDGDEDAGIHVVNAGHVGFQAAFFKANPSGDENRAVLTSQVDRLDPALVTIALGVNDLDQGVGASPYGDYLQMIVDAIRASSPDVPVLLVGTWHRPPVASTWEDYHGEMQQLADTVAGVSYLDLRYHVAPASSTVAQQLGYFVPPDVVHPAPAGAGALARAVEERALLDVEGWRYLGPAS
jgi:lysophospholipase L1-like esterase